MENTCVLKIKLLTNFPDWDSGLSDELFCILLLFLCFLLL